MKKLFIVLIPLVFLVVLAFAATNETVEYVKQFAGQKFVGVKQGDETTWWTFEPIVPETVYVTKIETLYIDMTTGREKRTGKKYNFEWNY